MTRLNCRCVLAGWAVAIVCCGMPQPLAWGQETGSVGQSNVGQSNSAEAGNNRENADQQEPTGVAFFREQVEPILAENCWKCHGPDKQRGNLRLDHRQFILRGGDSGPAVDLSDLSDSQLMRAVNYEDYEMPPDGQLADADRAVLARWVAGGLAWPDVPIPSEAEDATEEAQITAADRQHWAYRAVQRPALPKVENRDWSANPIDRFILARLEQHNLEPNRRATRRRWLRRLHYDLTGLPPTARQIDAFQADASRDAHVRRVDALLSRPEFGEKWGRHWLDLVRYANTNGYERDGHKPNAWRYRDYVIRALNDDKPYDRFVLEQLAGDEWYFKTHGGRMPWKEPGAQGNRKAEKAFADYRDAMIATGYYRLGIWDDEPADADQAFYDSLDDVVATTGMVFMATTVGCARCHDHKIDPVPQRDYYRMLAFFHNTYNNIQQQGFKRTPFTLNTLTTVASPQQRAQHAARRAEYESRLKQLQDRLAPLEQKVFNSFSKPEKEDAADDDVRQQMIRKRAESILGTADYQAFRKLTRQIKTLRRESFPRLPQALTIKENGRQAPRTHVLIRGNAHAKGDVVQPGYLQVLEPVSLTSQYVSDRRTPEDQPPVAEIPELPEGIDSSGRRLAFAKWLTDEKHPLTARVIVNRVWQHHFGRGLVRTTSDFGKYGQRPTHPQLLDYLAAKLIEHDWHLKWLHRMILTSEVYRMSSQDRSDGLTADPENNLFWRFDMRRLTAEEVRDTVLSVTGQLNPEMGGPSVFSKVPEMIRQSASRPDAAWGQSPPEDQVRRSIYVYVKRSLADPILRSFDSADTDASCPVRFTTTVPTQALTTLNGEFFNEQAQAFAKRLLREAGSDLDAQVQRAFQLALSRQPTETERNRARRLVHRWQEEDGLNAEQARTYLCLLILNLNEMIYLD